MLSIINLISSFKPEESRLVLLNDTIFDITGTVNVALTFNGMLHTVQFHVLSFNKPIPMLRKIGLSQLITN